MFTYTNYFNQNYYNSAYCNDGKKAQDASPVEAAEIITPKKVQSLKFKNSIKEVPFNPTFSASTLRTQLITNDEKNKYNILQKELDKKTRKDLNALLKNGVLLNTNSVDNSSVLDNLYKIITTPRAEGLDNKSLAKDVITTLKNPFNITQQFGDIPNTMKDEAINKYLDKNIAKNNPNVRQNASNEINVTHSGTCVAASIEFNLAQEQPAEFARFAEGLSSPKGAVDKDIHLDKLADNTLDAIWLLNAFEIPFKANNFDKATLTFKPDNKAMLRARIQTKFKDPWERTPIDVLMQSTFMQVGSQQSYNSLSDKRQGKFNQNEKGLIEFEKTFVESVVADKNRISVTYQNVDENARLVGYETDMDTMKRHITSALNMGENVIIGYTQTDNNNIIINGHEITITDYRQDKNTGKLTFICNDTDDNISRAIEYSEDYLLPKIHHAALPQSVVQNDIKLVENWVEGLNTFKELRKQQAEINSAA